MSEERFNAYVRALEPSLDHHRVEFSARITTSWALIYYARRIVRLSPYLFLLDEDALQYASHADELDATLRHEAAHAVQFAQSRHNGHDAEFHTILERLGVRASNGCDDGPENVAFRYVYACPTCHDEFPRRMPLKGNYSCASCSDGGYVEAHRIFLARRLPSPASRLRERASIIEATCARFERERPALRALTV